MGEVEKNYYAGRVEIHGWHLHPEAAVCQDCEKPATVAVNFVGTYDEFNLCNACLTTYNVVTDKIDEVFRKAGF